MVFDGIAYPNPDQVALGGLHPFGTSTTVYRIRQSPSSVMPPQIL
ncbi:MAG: hypothetical protein N838_33770 [Thiohalocapsa sp. PB-PSB1]|nr:MAG: hypothetical protein N838_33770 [Thiohalocapsa sp. PB-PSB1]